MMAFLIIFVLCTFEKVAKLGSYCAKCIIVFTTVVFTTFSSKI